MGYDNGVGAPPSTDQYFATLKPTELAAECNRWVDDYAKYLVDTGRSELWRRAYTTYYNGIYRLGSVQRAGETGEFYSLTTNHYRNLLTHMLVMTTSQRPAFEPRATNTDHKSQAQTIVASGILDYYNRDKEMDKSLGLATEYNLIFGEAFVSVEWDTDKGDVYSQSPMGGDPIRQGDVSFNVYSPLEVMSDFTRNKDEGRQWRIVRELKNKYDLAKKYPDMKDRIMNFSWDPKYPWINLFDVRIAHQQDMIPVYRFYHEKTRSLPNGRMFVYVSNDCWLFDGVLPYEEIPVYRMAAAEQQGSIWGYSIGFDLLPVQEAIDGLVSTILTNQGKFGVQNILMPAGSTISPLQLMDGLNLINYDPKLGKPESLNLTDTPAEIFNFLASLVDTMETIAGVNSVARGNPEASLKSGAALALVQSMAIQFNSGLQKAYAKLLEEVGTALINILKVYAKTPRIAAIAGKSNRSYLKEFTGQDLSAINRVTVDMGNPLSRTTAGKVNMADALLGANLISDPDQYIQVITTGKLEPMIEGKQAELMLIRAENEQLSEGGNVTAIALDNHAQHILEHKCVLASPESRANPQIVQNTLNHCMEHIRLWQTTDPSLLAMMGQTPPPPQQMPPGAGAPVPGADPSAPPPGTGDQFSAQKPAEQMADTINLPSQPTNPLTGEQFNVVNGGL